MTSHILDKLNSIQFLKTEILLDTKKAKAYGITPYLTWAVGHVTPLEEMLYPRVTFKVGNKIERIIMKSYTEECKDGDDYHAEVCILKLIFGKKHSNTKLLSNSQKFDQETRKKFRFLVEILESEISFHIDISMRDEKLIHSGKKAQKLAMKILIEPKLRSILREAAKVYNNGEVLGLFKEEKNLAIIKDVMES